MTATIMNVENVSKRFEQRLMLGEHIAAWLRGRRAHAPTLLAVDCVNLPIRKGEVLGLVGESGCGKSTLARIMTGILPPTEGCVTLEDQPLMTSGRRPRKIGRRVQMVFQNPFSSLNPRMRIGKAISEGPVAHGLVARAGAAVYASDWLSRVGLDRGYATRYPHQFSGGQRQRIAIARALAMRPDVLVCDEPVASLDVSIQAQIVNLFLRLRLDLSLTMLFISHDLGVVRHLCDRVAVMYLGRIVEIADTAALYRKPLHPYTRALLDSVPKLRVGETAAEIQVITGEIPSLVSPPSGCHFHTRCRFAVERCSREVPLFRNLGDGRWVACHLVHTADDSIEKERGSQCSI